MFFLCNLTRRSPPVALVQTRDFKIELYIRKLKWYLSKSITDKRQATHKRSGCNLAGPERHWPRSGGAIDMVSKAVRRGEASDPLPDA